jgi:hypothetical protein
MMAKATWSGGPILPNSRILAIRGKRVGAV